MQTVSTLIHTLSPAQWADLAVILVTGSLALFGCWVMAGAQQVDREPILRHLGEIDDVRCGAAVEHWANIFVSNNISHRFGLSFAQFMTNPRGYLQVLFFHPDKTDLEPRPLLPAQTVAYERILRAELDLDEQQRLQEQELAALETKYQAISNSGGRAISPMNRSKRPRKWQTRGSQLKHA